MPHTSENQVIALAVEEGFGEIGLFGVDLNLGTARERTLERLCVLWWLGYAEGKGITVTIPKQSDLLLHPLRYGYEYWEEIEWCKAYLEPVGLEITPWREEVRKSFHQLFASGDPTEPRID